MRDVVANVAEDAAAEDGRGGEPVPVENRVGELVEGHGEGDEERGRHDEAEFVHGEVVVDAVEEEMGRDSDAVVRKISNRMTISNGLASEWRKRKTDLST